MEVLDHGYVRFIEHWGSDERIIEAARMSTDKGFKGWGPVGECKRCGYTVADGTIMKVPDRSGCAHEYTGEKPGDEKLLAYLWKNKHATPFEMAGMVIEVKAPIFVFRQWHRHRTQSYNEMSARYTPMPDENYVPTVERCLVVKGENKQANSTTDQVLTTTAVLDWLNDLEEVYQHAQDVYAEGLRRGIPKEIARLPVPVARYSKMRASANLRNWLAFLTLRMDKHAQWEVQQFANAVGVLVQKIYPRTWELFIEGK